MSVWGSSEKHGARAHRGFAAPIAENWVEAWQGGTRRCGNAPVVTELVATDAVRRIGLVRLQIETRRRESQSMEQHAPRSQREGRL